MELGENLWDLPTYGRLSNRRVWFRAQHFAAVVVNYNTHIQQHWGLAGEKKRRLTINRGDQETTESSVKGLSGTSELTSTGVILHQKLIQGHPASAHAHHHSAAQNSHQTQLLGVSKLWRRGGACEIWGSLLSQCQSKKKKVMQIQRSNWVCGI